MYREELPLMENFGMIVWLIDAGAAVYIPLIACTEFCASASNHAKWMRGIAE